MVRPFERLGRGPIEIVDGGTGVAGSDFNMGSLPYLLESILRDATGPTVRTSGEKMVEALEIGLPRHEWCT